MDEGLTRRDFIKKVAMTGTAAMVPEIAKSAEKERTREEEFADLQAQVADIKTRFDRFKALEPENLKTGVAKKFLPEMLNRIKAAKDEAQAQGVYWALAERGTEHIHQVSVMYTSLKEMEDEMKLILESK